MRYKASQGNRQYKHTRQDQTIRDNTIYGNIKQAKIRQYKIIASKTRQYHIK